MGRFSADKTYMTMPCLATDAYTVAVMLPLSRSLHYGETPAAPRVMACDTVLNYTVPGRRGAENMTEKNRLLLKIVNQ